MGLLLRYARLPLGPLTGVFLVLVAIAIGVGKYIPFDVARMVSVPRDAAVEARLGQRIEAKLLERANSRQEQPPVLSAAELETRVVDQLRNYEARKFWNVSLLIYCLIAGVVPVWMLLQPRGHLGGYFLYFALGAGALGLIFGGMKVEYPAIRFDAEGNWPKFMFPMLFITIACGACSGFHSLIASGTTSKQLRCETDARVVGYGSMLLEGMVAVVSLCCVMMFTPGATELSKSPSEIYAAGIARFSEVLGVPPGYARAFALMAFTTFVYDTLDVCTRLGRFIIQELLGLHNWVGRLLGTALTAGVPLFFLLRHPVDAPVEVWRVFWDLFGASNQLLAALTLLGVTVWLWRTRKALWVWPVVGLPAVWMYTMSTWALSVLVLKDIFVWEGTTRRGLVAFSANPVPYIGIVLLALALVMLVEAIRVVCFSNSSHTPPQPLLATS
jgi:carbon starvation protein